MNTRGRVTHHELPLLLLLGVANDLRPQDKDLLLATVQLLIGRAQLAEQHVVAVLQLVGRVALGRSVGDGPPHLVQLLSLKKQRGGTIKERRRGGTIKERGERRGGTIKEMMSTLSTTVWGYLRARYPRPYLCSVVAILWTLRYRSRCSQPRTVFWILMQAERNRSARSFSRYATWPARKKIFVFPNWNMSGS
ncbi:hypothetical protein EYF80_055485 [Liparis tanakae]|uniref:Uncharacterized protein n=1 Tax=Liparis tanakae TaxID=230148 RepID=A0A4Z2F076_9TELE|nr:hypothetical protein EYF80_055485 [Liparis tanakae]